MRVAAAIHLDQGQRSQLQNWARSRRNEQRLVQRSQIILLAAEGKENLEIAALLKISRHKVARWRQRFLQLGLPGLEKDAPRPGRTRTIDAQQIIHLTTQQRPVNATHWSTRSMARAAGISEASVRRIWRAHGLRPHRLETFKVSRDPRFAEKLEEIIGLYLHPPQHALVFSVDEKCQIQALDRSQPGLPMKKGRGETMTHDYKRHGTTTLFAALNILDGTVLSQCRSRHNNQDWISFLRLLDRRTPKSQEIHVIADNYSAHKHANVQRWLARHKRFHMHFTPTSASWLNMVERFFRDLTTRRIRRGVFRSVAELIAAIEDYIRHHNQQPKPFIWTARASDILAKVTRSRQALNKVASA